MGVVTILKLCLQQCIQVFFPRIKFGKSTFLRTLDNLYNKVFFSSLAAVGLCPFQSKGIKRIRYCGYLISSSSCIVALSAGLTEKWSTEPLIILENVLLVIYQSVAIITSFIVYHKQNKMKKFYEMMTNDCKRITDNEEMRILTDTHRQGRLLAFILIMYCAPASLTFIFCSYYPGLSNSSLLEYDQFFPYYYSGMLVKKSMYYSQSVVHLSFGYFLSTAYYLGLLCAFISSVKHACGIFAIVSYRLENIGRCLKYELRLYGKDEIRKVTLKLCNVVKLHEHAVKEVYMIEDIFSQCFLLLEISVLFSLTAIMIDVMSERNSELFRVLLLPGESIIYLFILNLAGQEVMQVSDDIRAAAYCFNWLLMPVEIRRMLLVIMMRNCKHEKLTACSIFVLSNVNFTLFMKTCWSAASIISSNKRFRRLDET